MNPSSRQTPFKYLSHGTCARVGGVWVDNERDIAGEMGWDPIFVSVLYVVRCEPM